MKTVLLVAAASVVLSPSAASAQSFWGGSHMRNGPSAPAGPFVQESRTPGVAGTAFGCDGRDWRDGRHGGDRHHRGDHMRAAVSDCGLFGAGWGYYDPEVNRSWDSDSYNDWWQDRPDRAYPRWVQEQQARGTCDPDRVWWSGSGWHC
jgi:hypothetical protein